VVLMPAALVLIACGALIRNTSAVRQERAVRYMDEPRGILARHAPSHPVGDRALGAVHLISRGDTASLIFFGRISAARGIGYGAADRRKERTIGVDWKRFT